MSDRGPIRRVTLSANLIARVTIVAFIVLVTNYLAFHHYARWTLPRGGAVKLSGQTVRALEALPGQVRATVLFSDATEGAGFDLYRDLRALLTEYVQVSKRRFEVEYVDPFRDLARARELAAKYKFGRENVVILSAGERWKIIEATDLTVIEDGPATGPQAKAFRGEQAITAALLAVTQEKPRKIYVLEGHGEPAFDGAWMAVLREFLSRQFAALAPLDLHAAGEIPADAEALLIIGARDDLPEPEVAAIGRYWNERKGRIFVALRPEARMPRFHGFLEECGVQVRDDRLYTSGMARDQQGRWVEGLVREVLAGLVPGHPITKRLPRMRIGFPGYTQSLAAAGSQSRFAPLAQTSEDYWGEVDYDVDLRAGQRIERDEGRDFMPPLTVAAAVERGGIGDDAVQVDAARLVVTGNADFLGADALQQVRTNLDFALAVVNWLTAREDLIGVVPKPRGVFSLNLDEEQMGRVALMAMVVIPMLAATLGVVVWLRRRS